MYLHFRELDANVIVVGAGVAGMTAALTLREKDPNLDILILDINNDDDETSQSEHYNIGGQFVCYQQDQLIDLLKKLNIGTVKNQSDKRGKILVDYDKIYKVDRKDKLYSFFTEEDNSQLTAFGHYVDNLMKEVAFNNFKQLSNWSELDSTTFETFLITNLESEAARDVVRQTVLINCGVETTDISALFYLAFCNSTCGIGNQFHKEQYGLHEYWIKGGAEGICEKIRKIIGKGNVRKIEKISDVVINDYCIGIKTTTNDVFFSQLAIFTVFDQKVRDINFIPPLPDDKQILLNNVSKKKLKKFVATYEKPFWKDRDCTGEVYVYNTKSTHGPIQVCYDTSDSKQYSLTGLSQIDTTSYEIIIQLGEYFGHTAFDTINFIEYQNNNCSFLEMDFMGCFLSLNKFYAMRESSYRIFWANPETSIRWYGLTAGACQAGRRGAFLGLYEIRPNTLSIDDIAFLCPPARKLRPETTSFLFRYKLHLIVPAVLISIFVLRKLMARGYIKYA